MLHSHLNRLFCYLSPLFFIIFFSVVLTGCGGGDQASNSKPSASSDNVAWPTAPQSSDPISQAFVSGDPQNLTDAKPLAQLAQVTVQRLRHEQGKRQRNLYEGVSSEYDPTRQSQWIEPLNFATAQPLIVGDQGNSLASISVAGGGRSAGFGAQVLAKFYDGDLVTYGPAFKRLLSWLIFGDAGRVLPGTLNVAFAGVHVANSTIGMKKAGVPTAIRDCNFLQIPIPACAEKAHVLVIGSDLTASPSLEASVRALLTAGRPVLYLHSESSALSVSGSQVLTAMGLKLGPIGGNFWAGDKVTAGRSDATNSSLSDQFNKLSAVLSQMASDSPYLTYDWTPCTVSVGKTDCSNVVGLKSNLLSPVDVLRNQIDVFNRSGQNIFTAADTDVLRYMVLWADVVRRQLRYPMDKVSTPAAFQQALIADALVAYVRPTANAQADLGTFAGPLTTGMAVSERDETVDVTVPSTSGFTTIGRFAAPGKPVTVELLSAGSATLALRLNTQRLDTTRVWDPGRFNRPRFLASPAIALKTGHTLKFTSPYGGTLQLVFNNASPQQTVRLRLRGIAKHPFLDQSNGTGDKATFIADLNAAKHDWVEIKLPGVEIHSRADKMREVINGPDYAGNVDKFLAELKTYFFEDLYTLAGYAVPGKGLTDHVQAMCLSLSWNCTDATLHRVPETQHINVDTYAQCGGGCAGNPYDQSWGLSPRGWGESHEVGHNQQKAMHKIYDDRSIEVSNNLFPLHKNWRMSNDQIYIKDDQNVSYRSAFDMLKSAKTQADPVEGAYKLIWDDVNYKAERLAFYMQWVHYWAQRQASVATGWDIVTLMYLHQRQFDAVTAADWVANRNKLGYGTYATKPQPTGNDNMLIILSWITQRDQRPTFNLWGVRYSAEASAQVAAFKFSVEPALFYGNTTDSNHKTVRKVDMSIPNPVWPF